MRELEVAIITKAVRDLCIHANRELPYDVQKALADACAVENAPAAKEVFRQLTENIHLAKRSGLPLCQDTGLAVFFVEIGQDLHLIGGDITAAINEGVRQGYAQGFLRKSVNNPFTRENTGDNTPAVIHYAVKLGDRLRICFMAKGGGAENMSCVVMLTPAEGWAGIRKFVIERVAQARSNPCPPVILGLGIGGTMEHAAMLSKKALLRKLDDLHPDSDIACKEAELLEAVNRLGIGPMGLGGKTTCLAVKILASPCHIASLPLAVNIQCHSARHQEVEL